MHIESRQNPLVKHLAKLKGSKHYRNTQKRALLTSKKTILELSKYTSIKTILIEQDLYHGEPLQGEKIFSTTRDIIQKISGLSTHDGIVAEVVIPDFQDVSSLSPLIILDGVKDPGNLGTILRTALGLGYGGAFLTLGCVDPFNDKALRAAKGATFRLPLGYGPIEELDFSGTIYGADSRGDPLKTVTFEEPFALAFGGEGAGLSPFLQKISKRVAIPLYNGVESFNVATAAAICMYHYDRSL